MILSEEPWSSRDTAPLVEGLFLKKLRRPFGLAEFEMELECEGCRSILLQTPSRNCVVVPHGPIMNAAVEHQHYGEPGLMFAWLWVRLLEQMVEGGSPSPRPETAAEAEAGWKGGKVEEEAGRLSFSLNCILLLSSALNSPYSCSRVSAEI